MSVIIRLQNLPWSANALDIRQFFHGLNIPEGGVHIVGGELGDAFIAFSTDEDARQAINRNHGKIKEVQITLLLSSRTEMQRVIEAARAQSFAAFMPQAQPILPAVVPEVRKEEKKDDRKRRSRSRSKDRSRDRDRKDRRHRSRSRSRDRRDRRRRDRSRSRGRSRSRERKRKETRFSDAKKEVWIQPLNQPGILGNFPGNLEALSALTIPGIINPVPLLNPTVNNGLGYSFNQNQTQPQPLPTINNFNNGNANRPQNQNQKNQRNYQRNDQQESDSCVLLKPFQGGYGDIRKFFQGLFISNKGIKFINDEHGHRTKNVLIQFAKRQGKIEALKMSGKYINGVPVDISHIKDEEFEKAIDRYIPKDGVKEEKELVDFSCLKVEDLPSYAMEQDILHMFSTFPLFSLILAQQERGGPVAYVKFSTAEVAKQAYEQKATHVITGKAVRVHPCSNEEFDVISKEHEVDLGGRVEDIGTDCLKLSRLPFKTTERDVGDFFSDIGVVPVTIHLVHDRNGFTGEAYCAFESNQDASKAIGKHNTYLGNAQIEIEAVSRSEMDEIVGYEEEPQDYQNFQNQNQNWGFPRHINPVPPMGMNRPFFNRFEMRNPRGLPPPRFGGFRGARPRFNNHAMRMGVPEAPRGCTLYMDNVPYKAGTNEILDFFEGYNITDNVSRRFNANNTPSAEAKVVFQSPEEAFRALQEKNGQMIWDRPIYLRQE